MTEKPFNVLILCTGNSARSILGEALINHWGRGKFVGYSAGSTPKGKVHPIALELLRQLKMPTEGLRSKSWNEFAAPGAPRLDFVFTVCDNAAGRILPILAGTADDGTLGRRGSGRGGRQRHGEMAGIPYRVPRTREPHQGVHRLPIRSLDRAKLQAHLHAIGSSSVEEAG